jgi:alkylated DNA nucleotide flippase Atl1
MVTEQSAGPDSEPDGAPDVGPDGPSGDAAGEYIADVLDVVARIPAGRVLTYGDIAALVGRGGPRQVGQVMSRWGSAVSWWRVLRADGSPAVGHERRAVAQYRKEGTPMRPNGERVDLRRARWHPPSP